MVNQMDPDEFITVNLPESGAVSMPSAYASWLGDNGLVDAFDTWWNQRLLDGVHGDAFTPFAERHFAPPTVQQCLRRLL